MTKRNKLEEGGKAPPECPALIGGDSNRDPSRTGNSGNSKRTCRYVCLVVLSVIVISVGIGTAWVILKSMEENVDQSSSTNDIKESKVSCRVDLLSVGASDLIGQYDSYIKINGEYVVQPISWKRGITIVRFDPNTCKASQAPLTYDTFAPVQTAAVNLVAYIDSQPAGTVLLGVSSDDAQHNLAAALPTLKKNGVNADDLEYRGKLTFTMVVGHPEQSSYTVAKSGRIPLFDSKRFNENCTVQWKSVGYYLERLREYSSVAINNHLYLDPLQPCSGIYLYVIDILKCSPVRQEHYDTRTDPSAGGRLQTFLQSLPSGTFLAGVTCESASEHLYPASITLASMGVPDILKANGKMCFVLEVSKPDRTLYKIAGAEGFNLPMSSLITERDVAEKQRIINFV